MKWLPETPRSRRIALFGAAVYVLGLVVGFASGNWVAGGVMIALGLIITLYAEREDDARSRD